MKALLMCALFGDVLVAKTTDARRLVPEEDQQPLQQTLAVPKELKLTATAKIFCIGPNKAGTMTLFELYSGFPGSFAPCHNTCEQGDLAGRMWSIESQSHVSSSPIFTNHRAFMDNGDQADFEWLDLTFPGSRFVLNTRAMYDWVLSRFDMVRADRETAGCAPQGTTQDCPNVYAHWGDNTDEDMLEWIVAEWNHQERVLAYFNEFSSRKNRFAMVDVEGNATEALYRLHWVSREDTNTFPVDGLLHLQSPLPGGLVDADQLPRVMPMANKGHHDAYSNEKVKGVLRNAGCTPEMDYDQTYQNCAELILKKYSSARLMKRKSGAFSTESLGSKASSAQFWNATVPAPQLSNSSASSATLKTKGGHG